MAGFRGAIPIGNIRITKVSTGMINTRFLKIKSITPCILASSYVVGNADQDIVNTLFSEGFDPRQTLILETDPKVVVQKGEGSVDIIKYTPNEVVMRTKSPGAKLLFLSDVYDPGWKAVVDGKNASIYRADYDFRAVAVPGGEHTIRMVYWPKSFVYGLWIAGIGVGLMTVIAFRFKKL